MRNFIRILCVLIIILLAGCVTDKPEATVSNFIEAGKKFDVVKMSENINPSEIDSKGKIEDITGKDDESEEQYQKYFLDYFKDNARKITYEIKSSTIDDDRATVAVDFKYINGGPFIKAIIVEIFSKVIPMAFSGIEISEEEMDEMFFDIMKEQRQTMNESFVEKVIEVELIKINEKWYIDKPSDELLDVFMSNFISISNELDESMNGFISPDK